MFFFGCKSDTITTYSRNLHKLTNSRIRKNLSPKVFQPRLHYRWLNIYIPAHWKYVFVRKDGCMGFDFAYIYSSVYYFNFKFPRMAHKVVPDRSVGSISIITPYANIYYRTYWTFLIQTFSAFNRPVFMKVKFKGKGYYIFKNKRQTITPQFGHSHRIYVYSYFTSVNFLSKTHVFIFGLLQSDVLKSARMIKEMRPINIFTGRGVRFSRQIIYKKVGKVSSYR
jgi:hypothetical protein